jgi:D-glycero-alpha-D-manno-heptose-7-phosphate kinase
MQFILSRTPFRISFFGGGSDYPAWLERSGGAILSTTIDKYIYLSCRYLPPFFGIRHRIVWRHVELVDTISEILHPAVREGLRYLKFDDSRGLEIHYQADLPARTGMGSSSSFVVGLMAGLKALQQKQASRKDLALLAIDLEQNTMGDIVGSQDQIAAAYGGFNRIEFMKGGGFDVAPVGLSADREAEFTARLMLFYIGSNRFSSDIARSVVAGMDANQAKIERMVALVDEAIDAIKSGDLDDVGHMLHETWTLKRGLSDQVSTSTVDEIYDTARAAGALGGKLLGAGGTGFMLFYVPHEFQTTVREAITPHCMEVPFRFDKTGSTIIHQSEQAAEDTSK